MKLLSWIDFQKHLGKYKKLNAYFLKNEWF